MHKIDDYYVSVSTAKLTTSISKSNVEKIISLLMNEHDHLPKKDTLLIIDADSLAGLHHLFACIHFALKSFSQKNNIANNLNTEIMLFLAGKRQINKAISDVGISTTTKRIAMIHLISQSRRKQIRTAFDFKKFFDVLKINLIDFKTDINELVIVNFEKIKRNLSISNELIETFSSKGQQLTNEYVEKIAIEKSASLNLDK